MKTLIPVLSALITVLPVFAANLLVDRDTSNHAADYHDLQAAVDAASPGDTLHVMPSDASYGTFSITKSLNLIGNGAKRADAFDGIEPDRTAVENVLVQPGTSDVFFSGFEVLGRFAFIGDSSMTRAERLIRNIYIFRNHFKYTQSGYAIAGWGELELGSNQSGDAVGIYFINNIIGRDGVLLGRNGLEETDPRYNFEDVIFEGNIFEDSKLALGDDTHLRGVNPGRVSATVRNNHFTSSPTQYVIKMQDGSFYNNVFEGADEYFFRIIANYQTEEEVVIENNCFVLGYGKTVEILPSDIPAETDGNFVVESVEEVVALDGTGIIRTEFSPLPAGPLIGSGKYGGDIGVFGGGHPWPEHLQPPIPFIKHMTGPTIVNPEEGMTLSIEVESSN